MREREKERMGGAEAERVLSRLGAEQNPHSGLGPISLRSQPKLKPRIGHPTNWSQPGTPRYVIFSYNNF